MRNLASRYARMHQEHRQAFLDSWEEWKGARGNSAHESFLFEQDNRVKVLISNEQMYCRFATLWATMSIMEMMWEGRGENEEE